MTHLFSKEGAVSGTRTRDPQLGKLMLYQLSYYRKAPSATRSHRMPLGGIKATRASTLPTKTLLCKFCRCASRGGVP